jgi:hypothetical protein
MSYPSKSSRLARLGLHRGFTDALTPASRNALPVGGRGSGATRRPRPNELPPEALAATSVNRCSCYVLPMPEPTRFAPTPATQLRDCQGWHIRLTCRRCNRVVALPLVQIGRTLREPTPPLWRAARRFRCRQCGQPRATVELLSGVDEARAPREIKTIPRAVG